MSRVRSYKQRAGRYRFFDFFKAGALLTVAVYVIAILLVPRIWPLHP